MRIRDGARELSGLLSHCLSRSHLRTLKRTSSSGESMEIADEGYPLPWPSTYTERPRDR